MVRDSGNCHNRKLIENFFRIPMTLDIPKLGPKCTPGPIWRMFKWALAFVFKNSFLILFYCSLGLRVLDYADHTQLLRPR